MAFGRGKVIVLGEHSVVYGRPALAAGLARGVHAQAVVAEEDRLCIPAWNLVIEPSSQSDEALSNAFSEVCALLPVDRPALSVTADVELPPGAGLGCSAALGVAVLGALDEAMGRLRSSDEMIEASLVWERVFHGNPSGVDSTMAACGGMMLFKKGDPRQPVHTEERILFVVAHSGESSETRAMVDAVSRQYQREPDRVGKVFDAIAAVVNNGRTAVQDGNLEHLGQLMDMNSMLLNGLMVSTARLEEMCAAARDAGAYGAKLTGAGGGGCMIALVDEDRAEAVAAALAPLSREHFVTEAGA